MATSIPDSPALNRRHLIAGGLAAIGGLSLGAPLARATGSDEVSHAAEAIHQERVFKAARQRVYAALTRSAAFDRITQLSGVMRIPQMAKMQRPTEIGAQAGSAFVLFGGYITGRQIELRPGERIVQAWRVGSWEPGVYSIARFALIDDPAGCKVVFDHTGFPAGRGEELASGWQEHYWGPMEQSLA